MYLWPKTLEVPVMDPAKYVSFAFVMIFSVPACYVLCYLIAIFQSHEAAGRNPPCESRKGDEAEKERFDGCF